MSHHFKHGTIDFDQVVTGPGFAQLSFVDVHTSAGTSVIVPIEVLRETSRKYRKARGSRYKKHARSQHMAVKLSKKVGLSDEEAMAFVWAVAGCTMEHRDRAQRARLRSTVDAILKDSGSVRIVGVDVGDNVLWMICETDTKPSAVRH